MRNKFLSARNEHSGCCAKWNENAPANRTNRTKRTIFHQRGEIFLERLLSGFNLFNYRCIQCNCRSLHRYFILYMYIPYIRVENAGSFSSAPPTVTISIRVHLLLFCVTVTILMRSSVEDEIDFRYPIVLGRFFFEEHSFGSCRNLCLYKVKLHWAECK